MAERQETSVMVSIQEILRDAQSREEQEKLEAERRGREEEQRRLDEIRRKQEEEAARLKAEEDERQRKMFEEQRRQAEILALQEATVQKAKMEAESQARLAEMTARQEHERKLHALGQDQGKKRLQQIAIGLGVVFVLAIGVTGFMVKQANDKAAAVEAQLKTLQDEKDKADQDRKKLEMALQNTTDPQKIAELQAQLDEAKKHADDISRQMGSTKSGTGTGYKPPPKSGTGGTTGGGGGGSKCQPGDPLCAGI
jgi:membrane protein involved in colicin uptake